jgi:hypothetical protein
MDRAGWTYPTGDIRVSDADRDRAIGELSEARQVGRITADEFDERSGQAVAARTGKELTALLTDLPAEPVPAVRSTRPERPHRLPASRTAVAAAVAAVCCAAISVGNAMSRGPSQAQREAIWNMARRDGIPVPRTLPPGPGFDWGGTISPAVVALLLVVLIIYLRLRPDRSGDS